MAMEPWPGLGEVANYAWTGGAGLLGRIMYHARQVQQGKRKPLSWALLLDLPIAFGMGWIAYGLCVWLALAPQVTVSAAIAASYLGPLSLDRIFWRHVDRLIPGAATSKAKD